MAIGKSVDIDHLRKPAGFSGFIRKGFFKSIRLPPFGIEPGSFFAGTDHKFSIDFYLKRSIAINPKEF